MNKKQKSNLATTAIYLIDNKDKINFDMETFAHSGDPYDCILSPTKLIPIKNECGTSCCFAGHGVYALKETKENVKKFEDWDEYANDRFLGKYDSKNYDFMFDFLFGSNWRNKPIQAAKRALMVLEKDKELETMKKKYAEDVALNYKKKYLKGVSKEEVRERLTKFL
jgi:hypothetical protein